MLTFLIQISHFSHSSRSGPLFPLISLDFTRNVFYLIMQQWNNNQQLQNSLKIPQKVMPLQVKTFQTGWQFIAVKNAATKMNSARGYRSQT